MVDDALASWEQRALAGAVAPYEDRLTVAKSVLDNVAGLGPLQAYLDDPEIEEIWINDPAQVYVARRGEAELTPTILTAQQVRDLVEHMLKLSGRRLDLSSPFVDASLPGGERLHAVIPDVTREHWSVNIRKYVTRANHLGDLVALGSLNQQAAEFLGAAVASGLNVLVAGGTQAGKTTFLNALAGSIPPRERVITCEEVFELRSLCGTSSGCSAGNPRSRAPARFPCAGSSRRRCACAPTASSSARCARPSPWTCWSRSTLGCLACVRSTRTPRATPSPRCARCRCLPARTCPTASWCRPSPQPSTWWSTSTSTRVGASAARDRRRLGARRAGHHRGERPVSQGGRRAVRGDGFPPEEERFARAGYRLSDLLARQP